MVTFIGIGAQKSGTSWLFRQFRKSNQFDLPPIKELHYFDRHQDYLSPNFLSKTKIASRIINPKWTFNAINRICREKNYRSWYKKFYFSDYTDDWYLSLFNNFSKCTGEISPAYALLKEEDVFRMSRLVGADTKIIFMLRNPIERAWSSYKYINRKQDFTASDLEGARNFITSDQQILRSKYLDTIDLYKKYFDSVFIGFFDAIIDRPRELLTEIFNYLELDVDEIPSISGINKKINASKQIKIPNEIKRLLKEMYGKDILDLAKIYGNYFLKWSDPDSFSRFNLKTIKTNLIIK